MVEDTSIPVLADWRGDECLAGFLTLEKEVAARPTLTWSGTVERLLGGTVGLSASPWIHEGRRVCRERRANTNFLVR